MNLICYNYNNGFDASKLVKNKIKKKICYINNLITIESSPSKRSIKKNKIDQSGAAGNVVTAYG